MDFINYLLNGKTDIHWANEIDPNVIPPPKRELKWYENTEMRNKVNSIFFALGTLSAVAAVLTPLYFTATLLTAIITTSLTLGAIALLIGAVYLSRMEPSELDPIYRLEKRQKLIAESEVPSFSKLNSAQIGDIFTRNEIQIILRSEINQMDYASFIQRHGMRGLRFLSPDNLSILRTSYLTHVSNLIIQENKNLDAILSTEETRIFYLTSDELNNLIKETKELKKIGNSSLLRSAANMTLNVAKKFVPTPLMNVAQCTSASIVLATQGEFKKSAIAALGAVSSATVIAADKILQAENPEAYHTSKEMVKFVKSNA